MVTAPLLSSAQLNGPNTDLPAVAWLAAAGALCAAAVRAQRAQLLAPALLAGALAVGTKTTTAPLAAIALVLAGYALRDRLRPAAAPLGLAAAAALVVGGTWYLRNLIDHGSPTWPFFPLPWGDPAPETVFKTETFLARPIATLKEPGCCRSQSAGGRCCSPVAPRCSPSSSGPPLQPRAARPSQARSRPSTAPRAT